MSNNKNKLLTNMLANISKSDEEEKDDSNQLSILSNKSNSKMNLSGKKIKNLMNFYKSNKNNEYYENKITELTAQIGLLKNDIKIKEEENKTLKDDIEYCQEQKTKMENMLKKEKKMNEEKYNFLQEKYNKENDKYEEMSKKLKDYQKKVNEYNLIYNQINDLKEENKYLSEANMELNNSSSLLRKDNIMLTQKYSEMKSSFDKMKIDKNGLNETIIFYENKVKEQEKIISELNSEQKKLKLSVKNYEQLMADNDLKLNLSKANINSSFMVKNKINDEAMNLKLKHEKEILDIKKDYDEIIKSKEKDYQFTIKEYKMKISNIEQKLKEKQDSIDAFKSHIDINHKKSDDEINLLKLDLDNKKKELESKNSIIEEQMRAIALYKNENEKLNEKNDFIKTQLLINESNYMKQIEELKIEKVKLNEKIKQNEDIDDELDKLLIENSGIINKNKNKKGSGLNLNDLKKQKFNKCLNLINSIKQQNIEIEKLKIENTQLKNNLEMVNEQCNAYKNISDKINQPYAFLVKSLQDKDLEKINLNKIILQKEENINELKKQCEIYEKEINSMKKDLATIIKNREQINNLEKLLKHVTHGEKIEDSSNTDMNRLNYFINNFSKSISIVNNNSLEKSNNIINDKKV